MPLPYFLGLPALGDMANRPNRAFPAKTANIASSLAFACQPWARSRVGRRKRLPHLLPSIGSLRGETVKRSRLPFLLSLLFCASGILPAQTPQDAPYRNPKMPVQHPVE